MERPRSQFNVPNLFRDFSSSDVENFKKYICQIFSQRSLKAHNQWSSNKKSAGFQTQGKLNFWDLTFLLRTNTGGRNTRRGRRNDLRLARSNCSILLLLLLLEIRGGATGDTVRGLLLRQLLVVGRCEMLLLLGGRSSGCLGGTEGAGHRCCRQLLLLLLLLLLELLLLLRSGEVLLLHGDKWHRRRILVHNRMRGRGMCGGS